MESKETVEINPGLVSIVERMLNKWVHMQQAAAPPAAMRHPIGFLQPRDP